jgi:DNA-binding GntR family transcriptional regulator
MDGTGRNVMTRSALMLMQSTFARVACEQRSPQALHALRASVDQARALPADAAWDRKAAAHAEFHHLLAEATGASGYALMARSIGGSLREMITLAGPAAEDLIIASRRRMLRHLACRDADGAAREMEDHIARLSRQVLAACVPQMRADHG